MIEISESELARLAELSGIDLKAEEIAGMAQDLASILSYVEQLKQVDTEGVEATYQVTNLQNVWRDDEVVNDLDPKKLLDLRSADEIYQRQIKVPKVL